MIQELFISFIIISLIFIFLGYFLEIPLVSLFGFTFIFLLSLTLINENLEYKTGSIITSLNATTDEIENTYTTYTEYSKTVGIYLAIISALLFILTLLKETGAFDKWRENYEENYY